MSKLQESNEKIEETVVLGYKKIEKGTVDGFNKTLFIRKLIKEFK